MAGENVGKIIFIAPYEEILSTGHKVIAELGIADKVDVYRGYLKRGVEIARQAEAAGADAIVTRGGTAELIVEAGVQVPVVEIPITIQDLAELLLQAKEVTGLERPRIAVVAFKNMMRGLEIFARVMDVHLLVYPLETEESIVPAVDRAIADGADVVIGGVNSARMAAAKGLKTVPFTSGENSYRTALLQALQVSYARALEKERLEKFRVLVDYSVQGIIGVDRERKISVFNHAAERLLGCPAARAIGARVEEVFPCPQLEECLAEARTAVGALVQAANKPFMASFIPINVEDVVVGAMITFEDVGQIVEMEAAIRHEIYNKGLAAQYRFEDIRGRSPQLEEAKRIAREYAAVDATVLIAGGNGTGKELFAQSIHNASSRRQKPFVAVNCGAIPSSLLESELFGYAEGAFTGASKKGKYGYFEMAHEGTIFLDEIGEMDKIAQTRLLRVIQERRVMRLGSDKYIPVDVRIIAATNKNLAKQVEEGSFREDLYYRINVLPLLLPALKERTGDARVLAEYYLGMYNQRFGRKCMLDEGQREFIDNYGWPGNIRELRNYVERLVVIGRGIADAPLREERPAVHPVVSGASGRGGGGAELDTILQALARNGYNQKAAAAQLGMDRSTLYRKLKQYGIELGKMRIK